ncbi:Fatty-acid synthase [Tumidithrix helvetica PCC 7403]|uniref:XisH family protein n=1 Tax=Tumidithrix helvetica TaxID=3457545 RepID=UPI003CB4DB67
MPARDLYHNVVKNALIEEGWTITHDPLKLEWGKKDLYVDLGAEAFLAAEKDNVKIAVEVKSFISRSDIADLENALGQYVLYFDILEEVEPDRILYLAIRDSTYQDLFQEPIGQLVLNKRRIKLMVFSPDTEEVLQWIT